MKGSANQNHWGTETNIPKVTIVQKANNAQVFIFEDFSLAIFYDLSSQILRDTNFRILYLT